jgi:hypothetical protein
MDLGRKKIFIHVLLAIQGELRRTRRRKKMTIREHPPVIGIFRHPVQGKQALKALRQAGFSIHQLGLVAQNGVLHPEMATIYGTGMQEAPSTISGSGNIGGILVTRAVAGGLIGAMMSVGISREEAQFYQHELAQGYLMVTVEAGPRFLEAQDILRSCGAYDAATRPASWATAVSSADENARADTSPPVPIGTGVM